MRIVIAEDDFTSRTVLAAVLKKNGHDVVETVDGAAALEAMQLPDAPQMAILDWMMPKMDGLSVVRALRAMPAGRSVYLIMLTTKGEKSDIIAGLDAGADDYLPKPFDPGELRARVEVGQRIIGLQNALSTKVAELNEALEQVKTLRGIVPICCHCKKVRDDQGYWKQVEIYVQEHSEAEFSHGICMECMEKIYPEFIPKDRTDTPQP